MEGRLFKVEGGGAEFQQYNSLTNRSEENRRLQRRDSLANETAMREYSAGLTQAAGLQKRLVNPI